jgi:uncharacterized protein YggE
LGVLAAAMVLAACAPAQTAQAGPQSVAAQSAQAVPGRQITVVGYGEAFGEPDRATVQVGVETFAPTVGEATTANETALGAVMDALLAAGIPQKDLQTSNYSVWAEQVYGDRGPEGIAGYRVSNMVTVTIRDIALVDDVIGAATEAGANSIYGVNFSVADTVALQAEARAEAMADARQRAESLAELAGVAVGDVVQISEVVGQPMPVPMFANNNFAMEQAAGGPGISPGQLSVQMPVQVTFAIR